MLYFPQTRVELSTERAVALGHQITVEGAALVADLTGGIYGVKQSAGVADEKFVGVSVNQVTSMFSTPTIQTLAVGTGNSILLPQTPIAGTVRVVRQADGQVYTEAGAPGATAYDVDGTNPAKFNFLVGDLGKFFVITYRYAPTLAQSMALQGNVLPGGPAGQYLGQVGVITRGDVYTSHWDTTADWSTAVGVGMDADGIFTPVTVVADQIPGTQIIELPTAGRGYLGLNINAVA